MPEVNKNGLCKSLDALPEAETLVTKRFLYFC